MLAAQAEGAKVITVEGLGTEADLHPMQAAFKEHHALQCGFCTPGMLMTAIELATTMPEAGESEIRAHLEGNLCRCTGYHNIVKAIAAGARKWRVAPDLRAGMGAAYEERVARKA